MKWKKIVVPLFLVFLISLTSFLILHTAIPKAMPLLTPAADTKNDEDTKDKLHYVAIGDSLTEGVGDETKRGGFVPLIADDLQDRYRLTSIEVENYGIAGERSDQILKRIKKETEIQDNLADADFITLTVGGNDVMKVIQKDFFGLTIQSFEKPMKQYQERLRKIFTEIRKKNTTAPVYVLGIYNPFYLNFPEITDMQTIIDNWNNTTQAFIEDQSEAYFIPINDLLYQGLSNEVGVTEQTTEQTTSQTPDTESENSSSASMGSSAADDLSQVKNNALYDGDKFHPNNLGYQLMANAVRDELIQTQDEWLTKDDKK